MELRIFASSHATVLPDETIAFVIVKPAFKTDKPAFLNACCLAEVPGDISKDAYQDGIPDVTCPHVFIIGQVIDVDDMDIARVVLTVITTKYINDQANNPLCGMSFSLFDVMFVSKAVSLITLANIG